MNRDLTARDLLLFVINFVEIQNDHQMKNVMTVIPMILMDVQTVQRIMGTIVLGQNQIFAYRYVETVRKRLMKNAMMAITIVLTDVFCANLNPV